jgi:hypothetical protein
MGGDEIAVLGEFADERVDLAQGERRAGAALQEAAHEAVRRLAEIAGGGRGLVHRVGTVAARKREHPEDAPHPEGAIALFDVPAEDTNGRAGVFGPAQEL